MRYALAIAVLASLAAAPVWAQQEGAQEKTSAQATTEQAAQPSSDALASDWKQLESHWQMVESLSGPEKAEHLDMHKAMVGDFMKKLEKQAEAVPDEGRQAPPAEAVEARIEKAEKHWHMVETIKDPQQLETHLGMHMQILKDIYGEGEATGVLPETGKTGEDMQHEGHGPEKPESRKPEEQKPSGY
jgi:hypothetical protein